MMRRLVLLLGVGALASMGAVVASAPQATARSNPMGPYKNLVVIYEENHSFDNLYGLWGKVGKQQVDGIPQADAGVRQVAQNGTAYTCLLQNDANLITRNETAPWLDGTLHPGLLAPTCSDATQGAAYNS